MRQVKQYLDRLSRPQLLGIGIVTLFFVSGFTGAIYANLLSAGGFGTALGCHCHNYTHDNSTDGLLKTNMTGERECNTYSGGYHLFHVDVVQVSKDCSTTEIYVCEEGEKVDEYNRKNCEYEIQTILD